MAYRNFVFSTQIIISLFCCINLFEINQLQNKEIFNNLLKPLIKNKKKVQKLAKVYSFEIKRAEGNEQENIKKIESLDFFQRINSKNFKSPISKKNQNIYFQYDVDFDKYTPLYQKSVRNFYNTQYTITLQVGSDKQEFKFIIDTGSGTTLINDVRCESEGCKERRQYDTDESNTYRSLDKLIEIKYAKGGVMIELGQDDFYFLDLKIKDQEFGSIISEDGVFSSASYDGILGMSYPALSDQTKPFFDKLVELNILPHNLFALYISRDGNDNNSKFFLGGYDQKYFDGEIQFHKVIRKSWWTLRLQKVLLNNKDTNLCNEDTNCEIIMDSGASLMATPPSMYSPFIESISQMAECESYQNFPTIGFQIDDIIYELNPFEYVLGSESEVDYKKEKQIENICSIGFSIFDVGDMNVWIAGDIFLSKYFSVYDRDNDQVGLALAKHIINKQLINFNIIN